MKTGLKDIKNRVLRIGDTIAMCSWNYDLSKFGQAGKEYWFHTGKVYFEKGKIKWSGDSSLDHKLYDENFLIIKRDKKIMVKVNKAWDWDETDVG